MTTPKTTEEIIDKYSYNDDGNICMIESGRGKLWVPKEEIDKLRAEIRNRMTTLESHDQLDYGYNLALRWVLSLLDEVKKG